MPAVVHVINVLKEMLCCQKENNPDSVIIFRADILFTAVDRQPWRIAFCRLKNILCSFIGIKIEAYGDGLFTTFSVVPKIKFPLKTKKPAAMNGPAYINRSYIVDQARSSSIFFKITAFI